MPCVYYYALHCVTHIMENSPTLKRSLFSYLIAFCVSTQYTICYMQIRFQAFCHNTICSCIAFSIGKIASSYSFSYWWLWLVMVELMEVVMWCTCLDRTCNPSLESIIDGGSSTNSTSPDRVSGVFFDWKSILSLAIFIACVLYSRSLYTSHFSMNHCFHHASYCSLGV